MAEHREIRHGEMREHYLLWLVMRHFLSAELMRELCIATIEAASDGKLALADICEEKLVGDSSVLANWAVRTFNADGILQRYLGRMVQQVVRQGDLAPGRHDREGDRVELETIDELEVAFAISHADIESITINLTIPLASSPLLRLYGAILELGELTRSGEIGEKLPDVSIDTNSPLRCMITKHLGDLCGDGDFWDVALRYYVDAEVELERVTDPAWASLSASLGTMLTQSRAVAERMLEGSSSSAALLQGLTDQASLEGQTLALMNASIDYRYARAALNPMEAHFPNPGSVILAPQILDAQNLGYAMTAWADKQYPEARRWFCAVLRRQIALGSSQYSRNTRAYYGLCIVDAVQANLKNGRNSKHFAFGVRMLVESGRHEAVDTSDWSKLLVEAHVDKNLVLSIIPRARRYPGTITERTLVVVALFKKWLEVLPPARTDAAETMLLFLSEIALKYPRDFVGSRNIGGSAMSAIRKIGGERPEFNKASIYPVASAIIAALARGKIMEIGDALETALVFVDDLDTDLIADLSRKIVSITGAMQNGNAPWIVTQPAVAFLSSKAVMEHARPNTELGELVVTELLRLSLENEQENDTVMYLLRDIDPQFLEGKLDRGKLDLVVENIRRTALKTNSSSCISAIQALLVAPGVAGREGILDALTALTSIIGSTKANSTKIAFSQAYVPLITLAKHRSQVAAGLGIGDAELAKMVSTLGLLVEKMWEVGTESPVIFSGFSIPAATTPSDVLVHNWTYASLLFASEFGSLEAMEQAIIRAARNKDLHKAIANARAVRSISNGATRFDLDEIANEESEVFYTSIGHRIVSLRPLSKDYQKEVISSMLMRCFYLGPNGLDAGLMLAALDLGIVINASDPSASSYRQRLLRDGTLRNSLIPLLNHIVDSGGW